MSPDRHGWTAYVARKKGIRVVVKAPKPHKYRARAEVVDGIRFDSAREAARYRELKLMEAAGEITDLTVHPGFPLYATPLYRDVPPLELIYVGRFHADFKYADNRRGITVIEDVKSNPTRTEAYKLRKKIVEANHGIVISEVL